MDGRTQFKLLVCGSRSFSDLPLLQKEIDTYLSGLDETCDSVNNPPEVMIISGCAAGADTLGELYALFQNFRVLKFPADWNTYGKRAGYIRNEQMIKECDAMIAFWDGKSRGTRHTINLAKKYKKRFHVVITKDSC